MVLDVVVQDANYAVIIVSLRRPTRPSGREKRKCREARVGDGNTFYCKRVLLPKKCSEISRSALLTPLTRSTMHSLCPRHQSQEWLSFVMSNDAMAGQVQSHDVCVAVFLFLSFGNGERAEMHSPLVKS